MPTPSRTCSLTPCTPPTSLIPSQHAHTNFKTHKRSAQVQQVRLAWRPLPPWRQQPSRVVKETIDYNTRCMSRRRTYKTLWSTLDCAYCWHINPLNLVPLSERRGIRMRGSILVERGALRRGHTQISSPGSTARDYWYNGSESSVCHPWRSPWFYLDLHLPTKFYCIF